MKKTALDHRFSGWFSTPSQEALHLIFGVCRLALRKRTAYVLQSIAYRSWVLLVRASEVFDFGLVRRLAPPIPSEKRGGDRDGRFGHVKDGSCQRSDR